MNDQTEFKRGKAEQLAKDRFLEFQQMTDQDKDKLLSELHVHQIELELQNRELQESQTRLEFLQREYMALYNEAPIGYVSLDDNGLIVRCNHTMADMFGVEHDRISGRPLSQFILPADRDLFLSRWRAFIKKPLDKRIDVRFQSNPKAAEFYGRIQGRRLVKGEYLNTVWRETMLVVISDITQIKQSEEKIHFQAFHDSLTGLPNRANLNEHIRSALSMARRNKHWGALLFMDMDRFKNINDSLGHQVGDQLLIAFAERLAEHLREEDLFVRLGGDEFVVLLAQQHAQRLIMANNAQQLANNLINALDQPLALGGHQINVDISIGISLFPTTEDDNAVDVLRQADTAMYQSKALDHSSVTFYDEEMQQRAVKRLDLEGQLRRALDNNEFELYFQPQVNFDGRIRAVEALLRWNHPERGLVPPGEFIPVAEDTGLIVAMGDWVLNDAIEKIAQWRQAKLCDDHMQVAVNVSPLQFQRHNFSTRVEQILQNHDVDAHCLAIEITESLLLPDDQRCHVQLQRLAQLGLMLSVDDFGTGYSSLSVLQHTPVTQLKIDRRFIQGLDLLESDKSRSDLALIRMIISMARELDLQVVAEGVETRHQLNMLQGLDCDLIQGYLFAKPMPADQVTEKLRLKQLSYQD